MEFRYVLPEPKDKDDLWRIKQTFTADREPNEEEKIKVTKDPDGSISFIGNSSGWLYLAQLCVEMAYAADRDPYFHLHRMCTFGPYESEKPYEVSFFTGEPK